MRLMHLLESSPLDNSKFNQWFRNSVVVDRNGHPLVLYHGTNQDFNAFKGMVWGSVGKELPQDYAAMRAAEGGNATMMPLYMRVEKPFNADLLPKTVTVSEVFNAMLDQAGYNSSNITDRLINEFKPLWDLVRNSAREEESGPHYSRHDFWNDTGMMFGKKGADAIHRAFMLLGFDGIQMTEGGELTFGAFNPNQVKSIFNIGNYDTNTANISESNDISEDIIPDFGVKIGKNARFWRGVSNTSGSNGATYGRGLYTTTSRKYAKQFGTVVEIPRYEALPDNAIRFKTILDWELWLQRYDQYHGILGARERGQKHYDIGDYVRIVFPEVDGVQIGTGNDAIFVAWPME